MLKNVSHTFHVRIKNNLTFKIPYWIYPQISKIGPDGKQHGIDPNSRRIDFEEDPPHNYLRAGQNKLVGVRVTLLPPINTFEYEIELVTFIGNKDNQIRNSGKMVRYHWVLKIIPLDDKEFARAMQTALALERIHSTDFERNKIKYLDNLMFHPEKLRIGELHTIIDDVEKVTRAIKGKYARSAAEDFLWIQRCQNDIRDIKALQSAMKDKLNRISYLGLDEKKINGAAFNLNIAQIQMIIDDMFRNKVTSILTYSISILKVYEVQRLYDQDSVKPAA